MSDIRTHLSLVFVNFYPNQFKTHKQMKEVIRAIMGYCINRMMDFWVYLQVQRLFSIEISAISMNVRECL